MTCFFIEIHKKEGFIRLDGTFEFTERFVKEWPCFPSYAEAKDACKKALNDDTVFSASVLTPEFYIVDDFCL
jgi:hypothetical protein